MSTAAAWEQVRAQRSRLRILEAALAAFQAVGFEAATFRDIAAAAQTSVGLVCRYFPTKEHVALALYDQLASDLEAIVPELSAGGVADRFEAVMRRKLALLGPLRRTLVPLFGRALDPEARAGVLGDAAESVRSKVLAVMRVAVDGATEAGADPAGLAQLLYGVHLLIVLVWVQDRTDGAVLAEGALGLVCDLLRLGAAFLTAARLPRSLGDRLAALSTGLLGVTRAPTDSTTVADKIVDRLFRHRRTYGDVGASPTAAARAPHLARVLAFVTRGEPVDLVLPAFPAKSPNPRKVLGALPDLAEDLALRSLAALCDEIAAIYPPGARLIVCSDGHVFADVVDVPDRQVVRYRAALDASIAALGGGRIRLFGLEDAFAATPAEARKLLLARYASPPDDEPPSPTHRMQLDGIHRFLTEDEQGLHPDQSRSHAQKITRERAREVVRRSVAWGRLVAAVFPRAVRLSIHPQPEISDKIGIHLLPTEDAWLTPWHGCVLVVGGRIELVKRTAGEARGGVLVEIDGRPSHLEVPA